MMRVSGFAMCVLVLAGVALSGCPRELQPPPPGEAAPCDGDLDCNGGRTCGALALCIGGFCESAPSVGVPCPEEGVPVVPEDAAFP